MSGVTPIDMTSESMTLVSLWVEWRRPAEMGGRREVLEAEDWVLRLTGGGGGMVDMGRGVSSSARVART